MFYRNLLACLVVASCMAAPTASYARLNPQATAVEPEARAAADLTLTFSYEVDLARSHFELVDETSSRVPLDNAQLSGNGTDVVVPINALLKPGSYTMKWRALSKDGLTDEGSYTFRVGP
ncbi:copper resistance protein CopC [Rhizobium sp. Root1220]|uniref:copper resistance CopC family protein n=1 Tax=Rhizobium sp. Root1220 TaxID=1736432 RepID=UPI0006FA26CB|nr:copper resistance protein CopC [Rhizobium sp. Root1220]KQV73356.1 hypothetical protein ASC90_08185 [Rhizobium sp. Root1220]